MNGDSGEPMQDFGQRQVVLPRVARATGNSQVRFTVFSASSERHNVIEGQLPAFGGSSAQVADPFVPGDHGLTADWTNGDSGHAGSSAHSVSSDQIGVVQAPRPHQLPDMLASLGVAPLAARDPLVGVGGIVSLHRSAHVLPVGFTPPPHVCQEAFSIGFAPCTISSHPLFSVLPPVAPAGLPYRLGVDGVSGLPFRDPIPTRSLVRCTILRSRRLDVPAPAGRSDLRCARPARCRPSVARPDKFGDRLRHTAPLAGLLGAVAVQRTGRLRRCVRPFNAPKFSETRLTAGAVNLASMRRERRRASLNLTSHTRARFHTSIVLRRAKLDKD